MCTQLIIHADATRAFTSRILAAALHVVMINASLRTADCCLRLITDLLQSVLPCTALSDYSCSTLAANSPPLMGAERLVR